MFGQRVSLRLPASRRHAIAAVAALAILAAGAPVTDRAMAQAAYPDKPVKIVVGLPAGSFIDLSARWVAEELRTALGGTFIVENKPGAATNIASGLVARAPADGYTLLLATSSNTLNPSLFTKLPYDARKDFQPVAMIASTPFLVLAHPSLKVNSLKELIALAKAKPGQLNFGSLGSGTAMHLAIETFAHNAGFKPVTVFYKSSRDVVTDLLGGRIQVAFAPIATSLAHAKAGKVKALGVTSTERSSMAPDIPTIAEAATPGYEVVLWTGLFAPAGTPAAIVERLSQATVKAIGSEAMQDRIKKAGGEPQVLGSKAFTDYVNKDFVKWAEAVKAAGLKPLD
jgi:tripartite-type tricarboxylate transporter receptor subunit TctC